MYYTDDFASFMAEGPSMLFDNMALSNQALSVV